MKTWITIVILCFIVAVAFGAGNETINPLPDTQHPTFRNESRTFWQNELPGIAGRYTPRGWVVAGGIHATSSSCVSAAFSVEAFTSLGNRVRAKSDGTGGTVAIDYSGVGANCSNPGSDIARVAVCALSGNTSGNWSRVAGSNFFVNATETTSLVPVDCAPLFDATILNGAITALTDRRWLSPLESIQRVVEVSLHATGGDGSVERPWTGWDTALQATSGTLPVNTHYRFGAGVFAYNTPLVIPGGAIHLVGAGRTATIVLYTGTGTALTFDQGSIGPVYHSSLQHLTFIPSDQTTTKIGVDIVDQSHFVLNDVWLHNWIGNAASIGLQVRGREVLSVNDLYVIADKPILIGHNPYSIDADHFHFSNLDLTGNGQVNPIITVTAPDLANITFDGHQAWELGSAGFRWIETTSTGISNNVVFRNVRWEQSTVNGWWIDIEHNTGLQRLVLDNWYVGNGGTSDAKAIKLRKVNGVNITNGIYGSTSTALDVDSTVSELSWVNTFWQVGAGFSLAGQAEVLAIAQRPNVNEMPHTAFYRQSGAGYEEIRLQGSSYWQKTGTLGPGADTGALDFFNLGHALSIVNVVASTGTGALSEGGQALVDGFGAVKISGTSMFNVTGGAGTVSIVFTNPTSVKLFNNTGVAINYVLTASGKP